MRLLATIALLAIGLGTPALAETSVGVTAAVNQDATGTVGGNVKTISLGDSVVFNQRIQTGGSGLVQVLLADGTTFMVGPNSDLVIDSFVYDPNAGTAQVTASFTKGVLRFIGGQTSKTEGGVTINTPVGTMGIRGAMVDVVLDPPDGTPPHVDMLFGNEVTLEQGQQLLGRLYAAGYSLALGPNGAFDVLKTPPGWGSQIQAALAGRTGTTGGAAKGPKDGDVQNSEVAKNNSGKGPDKQGLSEKELKALLEAAALYDELRNFILNNQNPYGFVGGVISYEGFALGLENARDEVNLNPVLAQFGFDADNNPVAVYAVLKDNGLGCESLHGWCLVYEGGVDGGTVTPVTNENGELDPPQPVDGYLLNHDDLEVADKVGEDVPDQLAAELDCDSCADFVRWGFWGFSYDGGDYASQWVNGDLTDADELNKLQEWAALPVSEYASATYEGDAVGTVNNGTDPAYTATGDLHMLWDFGARAGTLEISDFDGKTFEGTMLSPGQTSFVGGLSDGNYLSGQAQGGFVNNGDDLAAGVIGSFGVSDYGYSASGVFMGARVPPVPN